MMSKLKITYLLLIGLFSIATSAAEPKAVWSKDVGSGGHSVVCAKSSGQVTYELLDFYEARTKWQYFINLGDEDFFLDESWEILKTQLRRRDAKLADRFETALRDYKQRHIIMDETEFPFTTDSHVDFLETGCRLEQTAVRNESFDVTGSEAIYFIRAELYQKLNGPQKAGLSLHEVLYRLSTLTEDSRSIRQLTAYLSSTKAQDANHLAYTRLLRAAFPLDVLREIYQNAQGQLTLETTVRGFPEEVPF